MQISLSNWSMVESFRVNAQSLVTEDRREREFSEKILKPTILSEAALHNVCKTRVLHHLLYLSHENQEGKHSGVSQTSSAAVKTMHKYEEDSFATLVFE